MSLALNARQSGATMIEFALVLIIFLTFVLGITDFSRMLYTWNAATEATRSAARYAVVCDDKSNKAQVLARMQKLLPQISDINLVWEDKDGNTNCDITKCVGVTVTIVGLNYQWISPIAGAATALSPIPMPTFSTYLTREIMGQDPNSYAGANICS
ncbi:MAG: TadE/TadG family type IV pilus assembly protein [Burkholderiales bacterium]|nr:TadE/TadG family type IV pilus assembly protein [Burkholderiales bacterium]